MKSSIASSVSSIAFAIGTGTGTRVFGKFAGATLFTNLLAVRPPLASRCATTVASSPAKNGTLAEMTGGFEPGSCGLARLISIR